MTLLTPVPGASHKRKKERKKLYTMREDTDTPLHNRKDIFRRIKRP